MRAAGATAGSWAPAALFAIMVTAVSVHFTASTPAAGTEDVDVLVIEASDGSLPAVGDRPPLGAVDSVQTGPGSFAFSGWADFPGGASLVLVTSGRDVARDVRLRLRSLPREDVVAARDDPTLLYSGFSFGGAVEAWGEPRCLYLRDAQGARIVWRRQGTTCRGDQRSG